MRTGFFGGSFNPIHNGHLQLARGMLQRARLDEVWFLVTPQNPWKQQADLMPDEYRLQLVSAAIEGEKGLVASDFEFRLPKPSYTWNTLQALAVSYPDREFVLLVGGDNWARFSHWYHSEDILAHHEILVYPREGENIDIESLPPHVTVVDLPLVNVSSTEIRRRLAQHLPIDHLVPRPVAEILSQKEWGEFRL